MSESNINRLRWVISGHHSSLTSWIEISLKIYSQNLYMDAEDHESNAEKSERTSAFYTASKCCITSLLSNAMAISRDDRPVLFCLSGSAPASNNTWIINQNGFKWEFEANFYEFVVIVDCCLHQSCFSFFIFDVNICSIVNKFLSDPSMTCYWCQTNQWRPLK